MTKLALIGADPEVFVSQGPNIVHCIGLLGGTKDAPVPVMGGALQEDNVLFEFNVDPSANPAEFLGNIRQVLAQGADVLRMHMLKLTPNVSSYIYPEEVMASFPEKAFEFGCTPDYNAYGGVVNPSPSAVNEFLRTAGGHVHIGFGHLSEVTKEQQERVGCMCDYVLGLPSLLEDDDDLRRELYGKPGAIRYKSYGVEYRTLSNYWIWDDATVTSIHARAQRAYDMRHRLEELQALIPQADVQAVINTNDRTSAVAMLNLIATTGV
uniref:Carboxylate amine ligase domain-containing protein n=3 Tax=unclassified bacterial viruses TaxID=12333 RepID=A0AAU6W078_9VIRU